MFGSAVVCLFFLFVCLFAASSFRLVSRPIGRLIRLKSSSVLWFDPLSKILAIKNSRLTKILNYDTRP